MEMTQAEQVFAAAKFAPVTETTDAARIIRNLADFSDTRAQWDSLAMASGWGSPIQHYIWTQSYTETFGIGRGLHVVASGSGRSSAIAPLFRPKRFGGSLELIGVKELFEVMDFLYTDEPALEGLAIALSTSGLPIVLGRIRADSPALAALRGACRSNAATFCRPAKGCPYIALDTSWLEPERHGNSGRRSDLRRARRAGEGMGGITCEILSPSADEVPSLLDEAYQVEAASWKGRNKTALQVDARLGQFYRRYAIAAAERGMLRLCFLRIGGEAAAMQLAVVTGDRFWLLKIGYSEKYARCSPGVLLMMETIRYAASARLRSYEFLGAAEEWIRNWTSLEHPCVSFRAYPFNLRGTTLLAKDAAAALARKARSRE
jgi:CelD/BcsL family acetyltransferase involved in cellulose biosynthesis